jgi:hypothetical protein
LRLPGRRAIFSAGLVLLFAVCLCNCAPPIAPGYQVLKESREIHFLPGATPTLQIQTTYTLVNSGNSDLNFVDVTLPVAATYGRTDLRAELDGHPTEFQDLPPELQFDSPNDSRISLGSAWKQDEKHDLTVEYSFRSPSGIGSSITLGENDFHIGWRGAFAVLEPPKHLLAPFPKRPGEVYYDLRVPADYRVLARGVPAGKKNDGGEVDYRYRLRAPDLAPFAVGGRYVESTPLGASGPTFWTFQPISVDRATASAIQDAWNTLESNYGPLDKNIREPHIVEVSDLREHTTGEEGPAVATFPGGALVNAAALAQEAQGMQAQGAAFLEEVSHALAHNWFGDQIYAAPDATVGLGEGLPEYATITIDEARGGEAARRRRIQEYIAQYDSALTRGTEQTLAVAQLTDPPAQRRIALAKAPLFFAALEDECGATAMQSSLKEIVTLLRGQEVGYPEIRSALERASGKNLAPTFRLWLNEKGIPEDFRARYADTR